MHASRSMTPTSPLMATLLVCLGTLALFGCVERKERIVIDPNGNVGIQVTYETESADEFDRGDAMPQSIAGWKVERDSATDDQGKTKYVLKAERVFGRGAKLPSTYSLPSDASADAYLQFPTTLKIERRRDGIYYHFHRKYKRREFAQVGFLREEANEQVQKIAGQLAEGQELGMIQRARVSETLVDFTITKLETFARRAYVDTNPSAPQDAWLHAHEALQKLSKQVDYQRMARMLEEAEEEDNSELFESLEAELEQAVKTTIESALRGAGAGGLGGYWKRYAWHQKAFEVTEDLGDEVFRISVEMPGKIVASNADSHNGQIANWRFAGKMLYDREIELMVTSVVPF